MARNKANALQNAAKLLGEKGGEKGGPARARVLTKQQKIDIARKGGKAAAKKKGEG